MSVKIKLRLPVPEGKPGDVVEVSNQRATALVDRRYAIYVSGGETSPDPVTAPEPEYVAETTGTGPAPVIDLPGPGDNKETWLEAAAALGIDTEGMTKIQVVKAVTEATS
jgi:hypothetical protein